MHWRDEAGFLEKMLGPLPGEPSTASRYTGDPIAVHLNLLLNTRRGSVPHLRSPDRESKAGTWYASRLRQEGEPDSDYGMPDVSSFYSNYPRSMEQLRQEIEELIRNYEPRLKNPRVHEPTYDEREFRVSFVIEGEVAEERGAPVRVRYRTSIDRDGQVRLKDTYS